MNLTRAYTPQSNGQGVVSVGRVQTPTLALVVRRDAEIDGFKPKAVVVFIPNAKPICSRVTEGGQPLREPSRRLERQISIRSKCALALDSRRTSACQRKRWRCRCLFPARPSPVLLRGRRCCRWLRGASVLLVRRYCRQSRAAPPRADRCLSGPPLQESLRAGLRPESEGVRRPLCGDLPVPCGFVHDLGPVHNQCR